MGLFLGLKHILINKTFHLNSNFIVILPLKYLFKDIHKRKQLLCLIKAAQQADTKNGITESLIQNPRKEVWSVEYSDQRVKWPEQIKYRLKDPFVDLQWPDAKLHQPH